MSKPRISIDGKEVRLETLRPSSHSATLNGIVSLMAGAHADYRASTERAERLVVFTPEGRRDSRGTHARAALRRLAEAYAQARQQAAGELGIAADRLSAALARRLSGSDSVVQVELGRMLRVDERLRGSLSELIKLDGEPDAAQVELIVAGAQLPHALTGLTPAQRLRFRAYITPDETAAHARAVEAEQYVHDFAGVLVKSISEHASLAVQDIAAINESLTDALAMASPRPLNVQPPPETMHIGGTDGDEVKQPETEEV